MPETSHVFFNYFLEIKKTVLTVPSNNNYENSAIILNVNIIHKSYVFPLIQIFYTGKKAQNLTYKSRNVVLFLL